MSTNRTKIDWAYKQAVRIFVIARHPMSADPSSPQARRAIGQIATILRRAERRGTKLAITSPTLTRAQINRLVELTPFQPMVDVATIRECEKQLKAVAIKPNADGNHHLEIKNPRLVDNLGGYPERCVHGRTLGDTCKSCGRA